MRFVLTLFLFALLPALAPAQSADADTFTIQCGHSEVSCDDLFGDLVTAKFTRAFDHRVWAIFVYSQNVAYSDGSGVAMTIVGVVEQNRSKYSYFPRKRWSRAVFRLVMGNAYERKEALRQAVRKTVETMMAECEDSPTCNIAPRN